MALGKFAKLALQITQHAAIIDRARLADWLKAASSILDGGEGGLGPFNTVAKGAANSGRLIDVTAQQLAGFKSGGLVWVVSVKDTWRWEPTRTDTADNITVCNPTANGVNPGRFIRENQPAPEWMLQTTWFIDEANSTGLASDDNSGASASLPLATDLERQRRMGAWPKWPLGEYHLRYLSDVAGVVTINGTFQLATANIYVHGNQVNGQGKAVLASLAVDAVTAENQAANTPLKVTSNAIATSWTADGLLNQRCRMTSGAGLGGVFWPALDLGSKQAQVHAATLSAASTFTNPFVQPFTLLAPALNDTFVVESLVSFGELHINTISTGSSTANAVILDSLAPGTVIATGTVTVVWWASIFSQTLATGGLCRRQVFSSVRFKAGTLCGSDAVSVVNSYADDSAAGRVSFRTANIHTTSTYQSFVTVQRQGILIFNAAAASGGTSGGAAGSAQFSTALGVFNNSAGPGVAVNGPHTLSGTVRTWGVCQAGGPPYLLCTPGTRLCYTNAVPGSANFFTIDLTAAPSNAWAGIRIASAASQYTAPAFDPSSQTFTTYRTLTPANLQAALGSGGLNGQFFEPVTQCALVAN